MRILLFVFALVFAAALPATASDKSDVVAKIQQFVNGLDKGDVKSATAACASPASIIDEFPPHAWQGVNACADWAKALDAYNKKVGVTDANATIGTPTHVDVSGNRAYFVAPGKYTYKDHGKSMTESGSVFTAVLQKSAAGWRILAWTWAAH